ncbi:hypothetical protein K2173_008179 [Erythroxylum novogranatense]|uniref:Non-specific lipid-transfer protein n=1 Tax=Erythroxylum novogranatense TaxID=1862640 RepID=A0AAV8U8N4_9ROSI|nr:hypothetical protein K2173_008179 [Erythroxylum novogranatense]
MASSRALNLVSMAVVVMVVCTVIGGLPQTRAAVSCEQVITNLRPCVTYIINGGAVPGNCCNGIKGLNNAARTTPDRRAVCSCLKSTISGLPYNNFNVQNAASLPTKCGINLPYRLDPNINCNGIN